MTVAGRWLAGAREVLDALERTQMAGIAEVAGRCADTIAAGRLVHLFGTGHSRIPLEEMFPRYGSYPGWHPIAELSMTFHTQVAGANGQRQAMFIERVEGLAEQILANFVLDPAEVMIVFSAGGLSAVPIEMAMGARKRGLFVVAVTSLAQSQAGTPTHPTGTRLLDHADVVLDLCTPAGDAMVALDGVGTPVGPGSTVAYAAIVNEIKVQTAALLADRGALPPVITSASAVGRPRADELFEGAYHDHAHRLARALTGDAPTESRATGAQAPAADRASAEDTHGGGEAGHAQPPPVDTPVLGATGGGRGDGLTAPTPARGQDADDASVVE